MVDEVITCRRVVSSACCSLRSCSRCSLAGSDETVDMAALSISLESRLSSASGLDNGCLETRSAILLCLPGT